MMHKLRQTIAAILCNLRGIARELSDQNAYQRHLAVHGTTDSPAEWRRFQDAHLEGKSRQGRCC